MNERYQLQGVIHGRHFASRYPTRQQVKARFRLWREELHTPGAVGWASWSVNGVQGGYACSAGYVHGAAAERQAA